jgi:DNA-binding CsgD family transcriptional regulator
MGKSGRVRLSDLRGAFRLIGECRDLRADAASWRPHAFGGLCRLIGARAAVGGECRWHRPAGVFVVLQLLDFGLTPAQFDSFREFMRLCGLKNDPIFAPLNELTGRLVTRTRNQLVDDRAWYGSDGYNMYRRPIGIDHCIHSICDFTPDGGNNVIGLHRDTGERDFSARERRLLHLFHDELGPLIGPTLATAGGPAPDGLPPRLRRTLDRLLEGDSEKQAARHLGLSPRTVHEYVTDLYRHFGVNSRAELLARFVRRR